MITHNKDYSKAIELEKKIISLDVSEILMKEVETSFKELLNGKEIVFMDKCLRFFTTLCHNNNFISPIVVGNSMFETIALSYFDHIRSGPRELLILYAIQNKLLERGSRTENSIFERPIVSIMSFSKWKHTHRQSIFNRLSDLYPIINEYLFSNIHNIKKQLRTKVKTVHKWTIEDIHIGRPKKYPSNPVMSHDAICKNYLDDDGVEHNSRTYSLFSLSDANLRSYSAQTITFQDQLVFEIGIPITFYLKRGNYKYAHTIILSLVRFYISGPKHPAFRLGTSFCYYNISSYSIRSLPIDVWCEFLQRQAFRIKTINTKKCHWIGILLPLSIMFQRALTKNVANRLLNLQLNESHALFEPYLSIFKNMYKTLQTKPKVGWNRGYFVSTDCYERVHFRPRCVIKKGRGTLNKHSLSENPGTNVLEFDDGLFAPLHVAFYLNTMECIRQTTFILISSSVCDQTTKNFITPTSIEN